MVNNCFTDAKSLIIDNKEVKSIIIDEVEGGILYEKPETQIVLTSNVSTITYGESVILNGSIPFESDDVKIYQNNVLIDTVFTSNGIFSKTISGLNAGEYTFHAVFEGDGNHVEGESNGVVVTVNKVTPVLTLSCDKNNIYYNETVTITGTTTFDGTIQLYQRIGALYPLGSSIESNNGTFTYTFINTRATNMQIFAIISSTNNSNQAQSNILNFTYSKYSTNLTIEVPTLVYSDVFDVTGVLTDENDNPVTNVSVKLYRDNVLESTETTDNNGRVTFHKNAPTTITNYDFQLKYDGNAYYNSSNSSVVNRIVNKETSVLNITSPLNNSIYTSNESITVTGNLSDNDATPINNKSIIVKVQGDLNITSDKTILSYYDEDITTLTASYTYKGTGISGETVIFKNGSTILDTVQTDSNGEAVYEYISQGVGDVTITVECENITQTITIEDCLDYDSLTSNSGKWTIPSGVTSQYSDNGWKISANSYNQIKLTDKLASACSVEFTLVDYSTPSGGNAPVIVYAYTNGETTPNQGILGNPTSSTISVLGTTLNRSLIKGAVYRIDYTSSTISVYENDTLLGSANNNVGLPTRFEFHMGANSRYAIYKDLKLKPL